MVVRRRHRLEPHRHHGDVVVTRGVDPELGHERATHLLDGEARDGPAGGGEPLEAVFEPLLAALDEPVRVEDEQRPRLEDGRFLRPSAWLAAAERARLRPIEPDRLTCRRHDEHGRMTGGRVLQGSGGRVDDHVTHRREVRRPAPGEEAVQALEQLARAGRVVCEGSERRSHLPHRRGGSEPVADNVPDRQRDPPVRQLEGVVPVAADLEHVAAGLVQRRQRDIRPRRRAAPAAALAAARPRSPVPRLRALAGPSRPATRSVTSIPVGWRNRTTPDSSTIGCITNSTMRSLPSATQ